MLAGARSFGPRLGQPRPTGGVVEIAQEMQTLCDQDHVCGHRFLPNGLGLRERAEVLG